LATSTSALLLVASLGLASPAHAAPGDIGSPLKLNEPLADGGEVLTDMRFTPDGSRVIYLADGDTDEMFELYSAPTGRTGRVRKLNLALGSDEDVINFVIAPDGTRVVFVAGAADHLSVYSAPADGSAPARKLSPDLPPGQGVFAGFGLPSIMVSPDSARVVYGADQETNDVLELFSVRIGGGGMAKLNDRPVSGGGVFAFPLHPVAIRPGFEARGMAITPDSSRVVFMGDIAVDERFELYSSPIDGSDIPVTLNGSLSADRDVDYFIMHPTSDVITYVADQDQPFTHELYRTSSEGGIPVKLHPNLPAGRSVESATFVGDGSRVVFTSDLERVDEFQLYSVATFGNVPTEVSGDLPAGKGVFWLETNAAGTRLSYVLADAMFADLDHFAVGVTGADRIDLGTSIPLGFAADSDILVVEEVRSGGATFAIDTVTGTRVTLTDTAVSGDDVFFSGSTSFSADGGVSRLVYLRGESGAQELRSIELAGGSNPALLSGRLPADRTVRAYEISPDGSAVAYVADQDADEVFELFLVDTAHRCKGRVATLTGTARADTIIGTEGDDVIVSLGGGDTINARGGNDLICSGGGSDTVSGGDGRDTIVTGSGRDTVNGGSGDDRITLGAKDDIADGGQGNDRIDGGGGSDRIRGSAGNDRLSGGGGSDTLVGGPGNDRMAGGNGTDTCTGGTGFNRADGCETVTGVR
jgi:Ca2+-binding RTX toxin-like protein